MGSGELFDNKTMLWVYGVGGVASAVGLATDKKGKSGNVVAALLFGTLWLRTWMDEKRKTQPQTTPEQLALMKRYNLTVPPTILK